MSSRKAEGFQVGIIQQEKWVFRTWAAEGEVFRTCLGYGHSGVQTQLIPGWFLDVLRDLSWALSPLGDSPSAGWCWWPWRAVPATLWSVGVGDGTVAPGEPRLGTFGGGDVLHSVQPCLDQGNIHTGLSN